MNYDIILFDLDNCLLNIPNPSDYFDGILTLTLRRLSGLKPPSKEERKEFWSSGVRYKELLKKWGVREPDQFWKYFDEIDHANRIIMLRRGKLDLYDDVRCCLRRLKALDKKLAIISNAAFYIVELVLESLKIDSFFDEKFGLGADKDQSIAKPSPAGILSVLKRLGFNSGHSRALMVGDSIVDIYAAKEAGIEACLIKREPGKYPEGYTSWDFLPDHEIESLDEIFEL